MTRGRKGAKRPEQRILDHDDELAELASVIAEYSLDNNAGGWFRPAWRNGWNAVELATKASPTCAEKVWLETVCYERLGNAEAYFSAAEMLGVPGGHTNVDDVMIRAALRCLQILIANSSGGGEVYNTILVEPFSKRLPEDVFGHVLEYRCRDSIGTTAILQGDINDRQRRAFSIAWNRGLYVASYALPPAIRAESGKLIVHKEARNG